MPSEMDSELDTGVIDEADLEELSDEAILEDEDLEEALGEDDEDLDLAEDDEADDDVDVAEATTETEETLGDEDEDELDDDDVEASLDVILKERLVVPDDDEEGDEEDEGTDLEDRVDGAMRVLPKQPGEFVCLSCFLVKSESQLADRARTLCPTACDDAVSGDRSLLDDLVDYGVYAPLGAAVRLAESLPGLVEKGRARANSRIAAARIIGRMTVNEARRRAADLISQPEGETAGDVPEPGRDSGEAGPPPEPADTTAWEPAAAEAAGVVADAGASSAPTADSLAIPNYDALAASQVVPRLSGLSPAELDAVGRYEAAHRRRRTVLNRVAQLRAAAPDGEHG